MFGFGKREPSEQESVAFCTQLARSATIDPVLQDGRNVAFLISIASDSATSAPHFKHVSARSAFVTVIERRIGAREFTDPYADLEGLTDFLPAIEVNVKRFVVGNGNTRLFEWPAPSVGRRTPSPNGCADSNASRGGKSRRQAVTKREDATVAERPLWFVLISTGAVEEQDAFTFVGVVPDVERALFELQKRTSRHKLFLFDKVLVFNPHRRSQIEDHCVVLKDVQMLLEQIGESEIRKGTGWHNTSVKTVREYMSTFFASAPERTPEALAVYMSNVVLPRRPS